MAGVDDVVRTQFYCETAIERLGPLTDEQRIALHALIATQASGGEILIFVMHNVCRFTAAKIERLLEISAPHLIELRRCIVKRLHGACGWDEHAAKLAAGVPITGDDKPKPKKEVEHGPDTTR